ncbi:hypothetical protein AJ85_17940 [Alkalihalobacillus alcalophilus ATCC 27647 = CGMCC 1.3604]|uniref:Group-specific protein n=1 Tax=Alkalihalobacillus alcalophilus ATCC 27647 = CGMCC 1.3604 TaxID=1218173 RepID=A0A094YTA0_ALKAL|nr:hypothetical protein [Alkalihalobacillus alcalophilus]KGA96687.1 hypothetical protein BALCAV_0214745 [Alkalihalobacillus alcalophilus ATCC 27647 = CGMCC 1.3604]MED1562381.1 hypothetical protein [Alkalihalobacillus alcalophilus]THG89389.1 hypothetical protein AJ85_17940 [Alkalihalobacillus alcalophilus ATCC 27647 = CGMCC 1.3604]
MFDPTVFDNLKIGFENYLYDLDNLDGEINIINRRDVLEMATMSREFSLSFQLTEEKEVTAELILKTDLNQLAMEILEQKGSNPSCQLILYFYLEMDDVELQCPLIEKEIKKIWEHSIEFNQRLSYLYKNQTSAIHNRVELIFNRLVSEEQMNDIPELVDHILLTLQKLEKISK